MNAANARNASVVDPVNEVAIDVLMQVEDNVILEMEIESLEVGIGNINLIN